MLAAGGGSVHAGYEPCRLGRVRTGVGGVPPRRLASVQCHLLQGEKNGVGIGKSRPGSFTILHCVKETMRWKIQMAQMNI